jgi:hypothetical protein
MHLAVHWRILPLYVLKRQAHHSNMSIAICHHPVRNRVLPGPPTLFIPIQMNPTRLSRMVSYAATYQN